MTPGKKYFLIFSLTAVLAFGLLGFFANSQPNVEVVIINNSNQIISSIDLLTEKSEQKIRLHGIEAGAEVTVKFHSDEKDTVTTLVRFSEGQEVRGENIIIEPGSRVVESITQDKITVEHGPSVDTNK